MSESRSDPVSLDDAALNLAITADARTEAATAGHRLALVAELATRRLGTETARSRDRRACDAWDSCAAEVAADLVIGHRKASGLMYQALDLRNKLPLLGALLRRGEITLNLAATASWRTQLIEDPDILALVDAELADAATRWGGYSDQKLGAAIDAKIEKHDRDAVRRFRTAQRSLNIQFGKPDDATGTCSVFGRMDVVNAAIGDRRMDAMATSVCPDDPRTHGERRVAAHGVIMAGGDFLPCLCGKPDCPATGEDARGRLFDILILTDNPDPGTEPDVGDGPAPDPDDGPTYDPDYDWEQHWEPGDGPDDDEGPEPPPDDHGDDDGRPEADADADTSGAPESPEPADDSTPAPAARCSYTSIVAGGGVIPAALLADLCRMGASIRSVVSPEDLTAEIRYRPSIAAQRMIRARDMTCRFPGCDHPAEYCDLDHTSPYGPGGLTHPGNIKTLCRKHHLLKTFWVGKGGWSDEQLADGTIVWTSPSGLKHRAPPGSRIYFPNWDTTTPLPDTPAAATEPTPGRELRMPQRKRTRAQQRAADIKAERKRNRELDDQKPAPF